MNKYFVQFTTITGRQYNFELHTNKENRQQIEDYFTNTYLISDEEIFTVEPFCTWHRGLQVNDIITI